MLFVGKIQRDCHLKLDVERLIECLPGSCINVKFRPLFLFC